MNKRRSKRHGRVLNQSLGHRPRDNDQINEQALKARLNPPILVLPDQDQEEQ
jgi:hypothetical protein